MYGDVVFTIYDYDEVVKVTQLDYTFDRQIMLEREEAREEGREEGRLMEIVSSVRDGDYDMRRGAEKLGITIEEFEKLMKHKC